MAEDFGCDVMRMARTRSAVLVRKLAVHERHGVQLVLDRAEVIVGTLVNDVIHPSVGQQGRAQVFSLMREAQLLVFPSAWYETFGLTMADFLAALPECRERLGGVPEKVCVGPLKDNHDGNVGQIDESITRRFAIPRTRSSGSTTDASSVPILHVPTMCQLVCTVSRT